MIHREGEVLVGAEYQVFTNHVHILSISLQTSCVSTDTHEGVSVRGVGQWQDNTLEKIAE